MVKRQFYLMRILWALLIASIIYILIFSFAGWVSYLNYRGVFERNLEVQTAIYGLESIPSNVSCNYSAILLSSEILDQLGSKIALLEMRIGKNEPRVLEQKKLYSELEVRHFNLIRNMNENCNGSFITVLFFYSNDENALQSSEVAGTILSTFKREEPERIMVYSFDSNLESEAIKEIREEYFVDRVPFVLVNEKDMIVNLQNIRQLEGYLN